MREVPFQKTKDMERLQQSGWFSNEVDTSGRKFTGPLPGVGVLKLALLNKQFYNKVLEIFAPMPLRNVKKYMETLNFIDMLKNQPQYFVKKDLPRIVGDM